MDIKVKSTTITIALIALLIISLTWSTIALVSPGPIGPQGERGLPGIQGPIGQSSAFIWGYGKIDCWTFIAVRVNFVNIGDTAALNIIIHYQLKAISNGIRVTRDGLINYPRLGPLEAGEEFQTVAPMLECGGISYSSVRVTFEWD